MRTRNVVREDRKSKYGVTIGMHGDLEDTVVGDNPASGFGKLLEQTLGVRPEGKAIHDYFSAFGDAISAPLADRLTEIYEGFKSDYDEISDDSQVNAVQGEYILDDGAEYHIHFSFHKRTIREQDFIELVIKDDSHMHRLYGSIKTALAFVTHDVGNLLASATGAFDLIRGKDGQEGGSLYDMVSRNLEAAAGLLGSQLMDLKTGSIAVKRQEYDLGNMLRSAYQTVESDADIGSRARGTSVNFDFPEQAIAYVDGKMASVFVNLFKNAVKYNEGETIDCVVRDHDSREGTYVIEIKNPSGIDDREARKIVKEGYRGSNCDGKGFGYGLAVANNIVGLHGGKLYAHKDQEGYLVMGIELPKR